MKHSKFCSICFSIANALRWQIVSHTWYTQLIIKYKLNLMTWVANLNGFGEHARPIQIVSVCVYWAYKYFIWSTISMATYMCFSTGIGTWYSSQYRCDRVVWIKPFTLNTLYYYYYFFSSSSHFNGIIAIYTFYSISIECFAYSEIFSSPPLLASSHSKWSVCLSVCAFKYRQHISEIETYRQQHYVEVCYFNFIYVKCWLMDY